MRRTLFWTLSLALLLLAPLAHAGDLAVVPGRRIGAVSLGMRRAAVHARLHAPSRVRRVQDMILETWLSNASVPKVAVEQGKWMKCNYLTVFFQGGRAVQIEVSSPQFRTADRLSTNSPVYAFEKRYRQRREPHFAVAPPVFPTAGPSMIYYYNADEETSPAPKHFVDYCEALLPDHRRGITLGFAWKYGAWGALSPEPDENHQEALIVYLPGNQVRLNPNDGLSYSGT